MLTPGHYSFLFLWRCLILGQETTFVSLLCITHAYSWGPSFHSPSHWLNAFIFQLRPLKVFLQPAFETVIFPANMSPSPVRVYHSPPSELGNPHITGQILHEDPEQFLCLSYSWITENDTYMLWGWYGVTRQLQPPVPCVYKSHLDAQPAFHKKAAGLPMSCYYSSAHGKQCRQATIKY